MDYWKVHILIVALVTLSHSSTQQQTTSTKATEVTTLAGDPKSTPVPAVTTTSKQNETSTPNVTNSVTVNPTTIAPQAATTKNYSSSSEEAHSPNPSKTTTLLTTTVDPNEKTSNSSNGTKHDATTLLPQVKTSSASNNKGTTADKNTTIRQTTTKNHANVTEKTTTAKTTESSDKGSNPPTETVSTKSPNNTSVPLTTPNTTTVAPNTPAKTVSTKSPDNNASVAMTPNTTTVAPNTPAKTVSTKSPDNNASVATTPNTTTVAPESSSLNTTKSPSKTSPVVTTLNTTTVTPKTPPKTVSTKSPISTSSVGTPPNTTTKAPGSSKPVTKSSGTTSTLAVTSPIPSTAPNSNESIYINEIVVDKTGRFQNIELKLSDQVDVTHYTMMIVDGETNMYLAVVNLKDMERKNDLLLVDFNKSQSLLVVKDKGTGIAIYDTRQMTPAKQWSGNGSGLMDALVIGKNYTMISQKLTEVLTPGVNPFVIDPNIYGHTRTISRCSSKLMRNADMFALTNPSYGLANDGKCRERLNNFKRLAIKISGIDCKLLADSDQPGSPSQLSLQKVMHSVTKEVNKHCRCGLTMMHIVSADTQIKCCDGVSIDMRFVAASETHIEELSKSYEMFLKSTKVIDIDHKQYMLDSKCEGHCCGGHKVGPKDKSTDEKAKNVKVTVAVIVSCLFVFLIVVIIVIIYMKKKNRAVYQFRMSRLDEEDDLYDDGPDHEDFVGGQEATFDTKGR